VAALALLLLVAWLVIVAVVPGYRQMRRTGEVPLAFRDRRGSPQWWARVISSVAFLFAFAAPIAELAGVRPVTALDQPFADLIGIALINVGIGVTLIAQRAMGGSWRADVDHEVRTPLVTSGPFRIVRNPILTATGVTASGIALMVPNLFAALMLVAILAAHQVQVRLVEEPYLLGVHGDAYRRYGQRTGRFLPFVGRFPADR